ncbi:hypothetical protein LB456_07630 [Psychroflexus sp. CAK57W]|uniref:hypothetical protein n=1 Tax=Psychroflexus curvus TaxID=2873595 RepID=UPI001CC9A66D|nr:hypothetical protein [Psychroflexus curvus]MBZ9628943.1 hypothetical protein [Psychroflexus curvus]MBZ9787329.1 hypothetical protein [Psychroflexus curvus]
MKTFFKILSLAVLVIASSCQQEQSEDAKAFDAQMKETIKIHDEVMPKLSEINSMISRLETEKEKMQEAEEVNTEKVELYDKAIADLKNSHDLMMSWMENFSTTFSRTEINTGLATQDKDSIKAKQEMLNVQYKSAEEMRKAIADAIENAQALLAE